VEEGEAPAVIETISAEDRAGIHDLNTRYATTFDNFQLEDCVECWTEDGVLDETRLGNGLFESRGEIRDFFRDRLFANAAHVIHLMFNHLVGEVDGDRAVGYVYCLVEVVKRDGGYVRLHCKYTDDYVRVGGEWKFQRRTISSSFPTDPDTA
jgi:hypothetical protein